MKEARTGLVALEELSDAELEKLERDFRRVARREAHKEAKATVAEEETKAPGGVTKKPGLRKTG
jgi:parvulin-like peptidyl-prolyl isomerase